MEIYRFHQHEIVKRPETKTVIQAPIGLRRFSEGIVNQGLTTLHSPEKVIRIQLVPVVSIEHGDTGAQYNFEKDKIELRVPMNQLWKSYLQRAVAYLDDFTAEAIPRIKNLSEEALKAIDIDKKYITKAINAPLKEPDYQDDGQEQYDVNRKYKIATEAIDILQAFVLTRDKNLRTLLPSEDYSALISFIQFIENFLSSKSDEEIIYKLTQLTNLPYGYALLFMISEGDPRTLEASNELIKKLIGFVEHERIHQILADSYPDLHEEIVALKTKIDTSKLQVGDDISKEEIDDKKWEDYLKLKKLKDQCLEITSDVVEQRKQFFEVYPDLFQINFEVIQRLASLVTPIEALEGLLLDFIDTGFQEAIIAILNAQQENTPFLSHLYMYMTEDNCILPPLQVLSQIEAIAKKHGPNKKAALDEIIATVYTKDEVKKYAKQLLPQFYVAD